jgi:hydrogenase nickel incorporation protein HypA/HybF
MHELSIAISIVELAEEESERRGGLHITAVHLRLGALAGVVKDALLFSYEIACQDTVLAGSQLVVEEIPGAVYCAACDAQRDVRASDWFCCSGCGAPASQIVRGKELEVVSLEVEE